jgi:hypothetical protein
MYFGMERMDTALIDDIKFNCDVSDAQYWGYFSVCGLLMRYRDLFRSEKGLKPWAEIDRGEILSWISGKESRWPELEHKGFRDLTIGGKQYGPFDLDEINHALKDQHLIYGAGYGMYMKPTFFLAEFNSHHEVSGLAVFTSGNEIVRDLFTAAGMLQGRNIFLRLEPLVMLLLYKFSELNTRHVSALEDAFAHYGFQHRQIIDDMFVKRIKKMAERYAEVLLYHEIAESREDIPVWKDILSGAGDRKAEHYLRAIKDLMADTSDHGPYSWIIGTRDGGALSLTIALMEGYRRLLYPEMQSAYNEFQRHEDWSALERCRQEGYARFRSRRDVIVDLYQGSSGDEDFASKIREHLQSEGL